jgi:hypothetical protein
LKYIRLSSPVILNYIHKLTVSLLITAPAKQISFFQQCIIVAGQQSQEPYSETAISSYTRI